jgi:hypothetical protein
MFPHDKKIDPFFVVNGERDERPARRLYARFEHRSGGSLIFEAVDGDWMDQFLGEGANPISGATLVPKPQSLSWKLSGEIGTGSARVPFTTGRMHADGWSW